MFIALKSITQDTVFAVVVAEDALPEQIPEDWTLFRLTAQALHIEVFTHAGEGTLEVVHSWAEATKKLDL